MVDSDYGSDFQDRDYDPDPDPFGYEDDDDFYGGVHSSDIFIHGGYDDGDYVPELGISAFETDGGNYGPELEVSAVEDDGDDIFIGGVYGTELEISGGEDGGGDLIVDFENESDDEVRGLEFGRFDWESEYEEEIDVESLPSLRFPSDPFFSQHRAVVEPEERERRNVSEIASGGVNGVGSEGEKKNEKEREGKENETVSSSGEKMKKKMSESELDGVLCPICMEPWSSDGDHSICCLPCGHLYGMSCIKNWLQESSSGKCPLCNEVCDIDGIRRIYGLTIGATEIELQEKIQLLEAKCASLELKDADWSRKETEWRLREALLRLQLNKDSRATIP